MDSREYKTDFKKRFGVAVSTARYQLLNKILLSHLQQLGRDCCYRCQEKLTIETLSIEHIKPWAWEPNGYDLFMDLNNISFSHRACNSKFVRETAFKKSRRPKNRRIKEGGIECTSCKEVKPQENFHKNKTNPSGHESLCKPCRKVKRKSV